MRLIRIGCVLALLVVGFLVQFHFLENYPQPILFGDPGAYHRVGMILRDAGARWEAGEPADVVYESIRPYMYLVGVGSVYATLDSLRGKIRRVIAPNKWLRPLPFFRLVFAAFNTLGMFGCFMLARQLSGSFAGGLLALGAAAIYPSFALQTGRIYPEPVFTCLFVWSAFCYVKAVQRAHLGWIIAAGILLSCGFFIRPQLMNFFPILLGMAVILSAPLWARSKEHRKLAVALVLAILPSVILWGLIVRTVGNDLEDFREIERFGFFTFPQQQRYPYGFWMFLDSDGWIGPYQLRSDPFYKAMQEQAKEDPALLKSRSRQYAFTARYVASRFGESSRLVLDNMYRTYDRPANNYQWDYPFSRPYQSVFQKVIVVLAVAGIAAFAIERFSSAGVFFVPISLALLYGFGTPQPRYGLPAMLILIATAGAYLGSLFAHLPQLRNRPRRDWIVFAGIAIAGLTLLGLGGALRSSLPAMARWAQALAWLILLTLPFVIAWFAFAVRRRQLLLPVAAWACLATVVVGHMTRDRLWHEVKVDIGQETVGVEQEIALSGEALSRLRRASQAFVLFDIHAPGASLESTQIEVQDTVFPGSKIFPAMPRMGESTTSGGRNPRRYRQWWALPLPLGSGLLPAVAPAFLRIKLTTTSEQPFSLYGDRFRDQERTYEGPSFGDWPHLAAPKIEYDGDYRLSVEMPLESAGTKSYILSKEGERTPLSSVLRIRVITLESNEGTYRWESAELPAAKKSALGFFAYSLGSAQAELVVGEEPALRFPLSAERDFDLEQPPYRLCFRAAPMRGDTPYGGYVLELPPQPSRRSLPLEVKFHSGMSIEGLFFSLDGDVDDASLLELAQSCELSKDTVLVNGRPKTVKPSKNSYPADTGRWSVKEVF